MRAKPIVLAIALIAGIAIFPAFFSNMPSRIIDEDQLFGKQDPSPNNEVAGVNPEEVVDPALDLEVDPEIHDEELVVNQELAAPRIDLASSFQLGQILRLSESEYPAKPAIAVSGNDVFVVWAESDVFLARSHDGGETFGLPENLSLTWGRATNPAVSVDNEFVRVSWEDADKSQGDYRYSIESSDGGSSFGPISRRVSIQSSRLAKILTPLDNIVLEIFQASTASGENLFVRVSTDDGKTFGSETHLSKGLAGRSMRPMAITTSSAVHILWEQWTSTPSGSNDIRTENLYISTTKDGIVFQEPIKLSHYEIGIESNVMTSRIVASDSHVYVTWYDFTPETQQVYFRTSSNNGLSFSKIFVLSNPGTASINPQVVASGSSVFVLWSERIPHENDGVDFFIGPLDILLRVSLDGGITFSEIINLSSSNGVSNPRQIQLLDNTLYVVWEERPPSFGKSAAPSEILFLKVYPERD